MELICVYNPEKMQDEIRITIPDVSKMRALREMDTLDRMVMRDEAPKMSDVILKLEILARGYERGLVKMRVLRTRSGYPDYYWD